MKHSLINYCKEIGLDVMGTCNCRVFNELKPYFQSRKRLGIENEFEEVDVEKRINPFVYMEDARSIISIAFPYMYEGDLQKGAHFSMYTHGMDYHKVAGEYLKKICWFLEKLGGKAVYFVDSNSLPERYIAYLSGIGFFGKNNMIINEKYGSYFFLGEIITNIYIEEDTPMESKCGECEICLNACPTSSLKKDNTNPNICLSYVTQKKDLEDEWFNKLGGRLFGCDTCQMVCPYNKKAKDSSINEFKPNDFMRNVDLNELINMNNKIFKEKYGNTSCGWRGKKIIQRNALIAAINQINMKNVNINNMNSPYVRDYYNRLLEYFNL